jgi:hypothetical protein
MDQLKQHVGPLAFAIMTLLFGWFGVHYGSLWAQGMAATAFSAACVAFQVQPKSS